MSSVFRIVALALAITVGLVGSATAQTSSAPPVPARTPLPPVDQAFVQVASDANAFEVDSSRLALERSQDAEVRTLAQRLIVDHTAQQRALAARAQAAGLAVPTGPGPLVQALLERLRATPAGADFDWLYLGLQTDAHLQAIAAFLDEAAHGRVAAVRSLARGALGALSAHYEFAKAALMGGSPTLVHEAPVPPVDQLYAQVTADANVFEVASSELALAGSQDPWVRALATRLVADHRSQQDRLVAAARAAGVAVPAAPGPLVQTLLAALTATPSGVAFDWRYQVVQADAHLLGIGVAQAETAFGHRPGLRALAIPSLGVLSAHHEYAKAAAMVPRS
jgi:putative membrane protein